MFTSKKLNIAALATGAVLLVMVPVTTVVFAAGGPSLIFDKFGGIGVGHDGPRKFFKQAKERFRAADIDDNGSLNRAEFNDLIGSRFSDADADSDGEVTATEINNAIDKWLTEIRLHMTQRYLSRFDQDGDGVISSAERDDVISKQFAKLDRNEDGEIGKRELRKGMREMHTEGYHKSQDAKGDSQ